jgi:prevent-host-death family protein
MKRVGLSDLHQRTSEYLRLVKAGERIEITEYGRPIAMMVAIADNEGPLDRMVREGKATLPTRDLLDVVPVPQGPGRTTATELLQRAREDDR